MYVPDPELKNILTNLILGLYLFGQTAALSGNWFVSDLSIVARDEAVGCVKPDSIGFTDQNGVLHEFKIPEGKEFKDIEKLITEEKFDEVFALERIQR